MRSVSFSTDTLALSPSASRRLENIAGIILPLDAAQPHDVGLPHPVRFLLGMTQGSGRGGSQR
jgi:hypothetical protein